MDIGRKLSNWKEFRVFPICLLKSPIAINGGYTAFRHSDRDMRMRVVGQVQLSLHILEKGPGVMRLDIYDLQGKTGNYSGMVFNSGSTVIGCLRPIMGSVTG